MHCPTCRFLESCDVVFDKGGPTACHEHIILEPDNTPSVNISNPTPTIPISVTPDTPTSLCPKHATFLPVLDDDSHYNVLSDGHCANDAHVDLLEPKTYAQAMASPDMPEWLAICEEEICTWKDIDIYDVVPYPKGCKVIGSKCVFCIKQGPDRSILKHKARIIAQGFT